MNNLLMKVHEWLIRLVVGKRPVMMNMDFEVGEYIHIHVADDPLIHNTNIGIVLEWPKFEVEVINTTGESNEQRSQH